MEANVTELNSGVVDVSSGYIVVWVSSNNNSTFVHVYGQPLNDTESYYQTINVGSEGIAIFPIPAGSFGVSVGVSVGDATVTWTGMYSH